MVTLDEIKQYIGFVDDDDDAMLMRFARVADEKIKDSVHKDCSADDPQVEMLKLAVIYDLYQNRGMTGSTNDKLSNATRHMFADMQTRLRLKMRDAT